MPLPDARIGLLAAALLGALLGALSLLGDGSDVVVVNALANAAGPWLVTAFAAGAIGRTMRLAALGGLVALLVALAGYYVPLVLRASPAPIALVAAWTVLVLVIGPVMGAVGWRWRTSAGRSRTLAASLLPAALLAEAAHRLILLEAWDGFDPTRTYAQLAIANVLVAALLAPLLIERTRWALALGTIALLTAVGVGVLLGVDAAFDALLAPG